MKSKDMGFLFRYEISVENLSQQSFEMYALTDNLNKHGFQLKYADLRVFVFRKSVVLSG